MAWEIIAEAYSVDELRSLTPAVDDIPDGTPVLITLTLPWYLPMAHMANLAGAEWIAEKLSGGMNVIDVRAADAYTIEIEGTANGWLMVAALAAVAVLIGAFIVFGIPAISKAVIAIQQTKQAVVAQQAEQLKSDFVVKYEPIYGAQVFDWVKNIATVPAAVAADPTFMDELKKAVVPAVTIGTVVLIVALILFGSQYLPKPRKAVAA